jgi:hypothetical protein
MQSQPPFEVKFLVPREQGEAIVAWCAARLAPDPHADPACGHGYVVRSLYLDTAQLDTYHRHGSFRRAKYRVRCYGHQPLAFLERKCKTNGQVRKRRTSIEPQELPLLAQEPADGWQGAWFLRRLQLRRLLPQLEIEYARAAFVGDDQGPIRLTVDRDLRCRKATEPVNGSRLAGFNALAIAKAVASLSANGSDVPSHLCNGHVTLLPGQAIVEMKFQVALPATFKRLIQEMGLNPSPVSKYRLAVEACGLLNGAGPMSHS